VKIDFAKPGPLLSAYIERYWAWENEEATPSYMPHVPPGVGIDLYFHYKTPFKIKNVGSMAQSHLTHSRQRSCSILPSVEVGFIVVRFRCSMFSNFTSIPLHEFADTFADAGTIWGSEGKDLEEQIAAADDLQERIRLLENFLLIQLERHRKPLHAWKPIVDTLFYHHDEVKLHELAKQMKITPRHFRRSFIAVSGMSPKHFQQLSRFRNTLKYLLVCKSTHYLPVALDKGYFDQMHFIKEFKAFMDTTPSAFLNPDNFGAHFYYNSFK